MYIRLLENTEKYEAGKIAAFCFHARVSDEEAERKKTEYLNNRDEQWGAFTDDGALMGSIINNHFTARLCGQNVICGGIGAVSTLPEYRCRGAIRGIFGELLKAARERGEVISLLYPFSHEFYRKFGYESAVTGTCYETEPAVLKRFMFDGQAKMWQPGEPVTPFTELYNQWADQWHLAFRRTDEQMNGQQMDRKPLRDRRFCWLLKPKDGDKPFAYVIADDIYHDPAAIMNVNEAAWTNAEGFRAILGFLGRFGADYGTIRFTNMPTGIDLAALSGNAYDVRTIPNRSHMLRVMNTEVLLRIMCRERGAAFTIMVNGDSQIAENNGTFRVNGNDVTIAEDAEPDMICDIRALARMTCGDAEMTEILLRPDVRVNGDISEIQKVFFRRSVYIGDHF